MSRQLNSRIPSNSILIIEDELPILELLEKSLSSKGYTVDTVESGEKGIKKIENNTYSLIFTDIKMPGLSGTQVLQHLKQTQKKLTPVVGMSGTPWLLEDGGFDAVLPKPFSMKDLLKIAGRFIDS